MALTARVCVEEAFHNAASVSETKQEFLGNLPCPIWWVACKLRLFRIACIDKDHDQFLLSDDSVEKRDTPHSHNCTRMLQPFAYIREYFWVCVGRMNPCEIDAKYLR